MKCTVCSFELDDKWNYCPVCKNKLKDIDNSSFNNLDIRPIEGFCSKCAFEINKKWVYCPRCSNNLFENKKVEAEVKVEENKIKKKYDVALLLLTILDIIYCIIAAGLCLIQEFYISIVLFLLRPFLVRYLLKMAYYGKWKWLLKIFALVPYIIPIVYNYYMIEIAEPSPMFGYLHTLGNGIFMFFHIIFGVIALILVSYSKNPNEKKEG